MMPNYRMDKCTRSVDLRQPVLAAIFRKEVAFDNGKVLLSRLGENVHATSAFCTHYGAPLAKGVLASDGRIVWYVGLSTSVDNDLIMLTV
jgi:nitrite reductase/ring-hydroxylating ferredoxin subunit